MCTTSHPLHGSRPRIAHQTAASHRVQPRLPQRELQLGTTMKRAGLAKELLLVVLDKCNSLSMAQHARKNTRWNTTLEHILFLRMQSWMAVSLPSTLGDHQEGTVEENNERQLNYLERGFASSRDTSSVLCFFLTNLNKF